MSRQPISVTGATYDDMWAAAAAAGDPLAGIEQMEELFRYDGFIHDIVRDGSGQLWLRVTADEDDPRGDALRRVVVTTHFLAFDSLLALKATLHDGEIATMDSYENASEIIEQVISYDTISGGRSSRHEYATRDVHPRKIVEDHLPFRQLKPGRRLVFGPLKDFLSLSPEEANGLYRYPVPQDETVVFHDCVRNWIGRFQEQTFHPLVYMVACIRDDPGLWVQHRIGFEPEDEAAFRATLAAGQAPTLASYRMAKEIHRETIDTTDPKATMLIVDEIDADSLGDEAPTYQDAAHHDREWPAFAAKTKD
jgi:hypothetical protein